MQGYKVWAVGDPNWVCILKTTRLVSTFHLWMTTTTTHLADISSPSHSVRPSRMQPFISTGLLPLLPSSFTSLLWHPQSWQLRAFQSFHPKSCSHLKLDTNYKMTTEDSKLCDALEDWREDRTVQRYGKAHLCDLGPSLAMPNEVLDRIIDCAHHQKISSIADLRTEMRWDDFDHDSWGLEVVALIQTWCPPHPPLMTTTPMQQLSAMHPLSSNSNFGTDSWVASFHCSCKLCKIKMQCMWTSGAQWWVLVSHIQTWLLCWWRVV